MSLRGRYVIDRVKRAVSSRLTLPCPPYENHEYWEGVYRNLGPSDVFEWGGVGFEQLDKHRYNATIHAHELIPHGYPHQHQQQEEGQAQKDTDKDWNETTFGEAIGVDPVQDGKRILLLGCGNSKLGEEMVQMGGWTGPIVQTDISARVISTMSERCHTADFSTDANTNNKDEDVWSFVQDDAAQLSAFEDASIHGCVDKGLVDALFCASHSVSDILESVHRVLVPGGIFCLFSFSRPEFLLPQILPAIDDDSSDSSKCQTMWNNIQIRQLDSILMYRYQKAHPAPPTPKPKQTTERSVLKLSNRKQKRSKIKPLSNRRQ
mmetsp:Transcript_26596/g.48267  ORF Transcript_26596/g.48267 Transcript_26596/m.48267 type:complete len:320 (-) Transcript_26596:74-1033(-)